MPDISVAIPTLNREKPLLDTVRQVLEETSVKLELIVADQSNECSLDFVSEIRKLKQDKRFRYYQITPASVTAAQNFLIHKARAGIILFLDDDVILKKNLIKRHLDDHRDPSLEADVIAGRIEQKELEITNKPLYFDKHGLPRLTFNSPKSGYVGTFPGANVSIKLHVFEQVGEYDTSYTRSAVRQESDMAYRITRAGFKIYFDAEASLIHFSAPFGGARIIRPQYNDLYFYANDLLFALKTVRWQNKLASFVKRYRLYVLSAPRVKLRVARTGIFVIGFFMALKRALFPYKIKSLVVEK
jgi:glycosyltransferase involved in cell wall biosynthesis